MEIIILIILTIWIVISHIVGTFGEKRTIGYWKTFWASFLLSPILSMLFVIASKELTIIPEKKPMKETPRWMTISAIVFAVVAMLFNLEQILTALQTAFSSVLGIIAIIGAVIGIILFTIFCTE
jgi:hypothetical protein